MKDEQQYRDINLCDTLLFSEGVHDLPRISILFLFYLLYTSPISLVHQTFFFLAVFPCCFSSIILVITRCSSSYIQKYDILDILFLFIPIFTFRNISTETIELSVAISKVCQIYGVGVPGSIIPYVNVNMRFILSAFVLKMNALLILFNLVYNTVRNEHDNRSNTTGKYILLL